jgi:mannose-6-phosphate isomerase-like protein (cupin superfamily)
VTYAAGVEIRARDEAEPFITADGSTIRSLLDRSVAPVRSQSLAEATLEPGQATTRHYHRASEEIYYLVEGGGLMEVDGERAEVAVGDAILIPPGAWHQLRNTGDGPLRLLCCCAPPYAHEDTFFA